MAEAERIGELHAVMVIPRLLEDLEHTLPVASYWLNEAEPLPILVNNKVKERQRIALPELEKVPVKVYREKPREEKILIEQKVEEEKAIIPEIVTDDFPELY
jgi:carbon dioxide concentrating mechanism protein CcmO